MAYFTSNTYQMKREILTFSNKFSRKVTVQRLTCKERTHNVDWSQSKPWVLSS